MPVRSSSEIAEPICRQVAALPWRLDASGNLSVLLVTSRTNAKWMLPKGWPMPGKSDADAAQIEAMEEAGIEGEASLQPLGSYDFIKLFDDGTTKPSQAIVFPLRVTRQRKKWNEMHERRRRWVRASKAAELVHEPDLARLLRSLAAGPIPQL